MAEQFQREVCLRDMNSLATPCEVSAYAVLSEPQQLPELIERARAEGLPLLPLGEGSNVVLAEQLEALVVRQSCRGISILKDQGSRCRVKVSAGENWHEFVLWSVQQGFWGLENLALIPGTVGAAPVQNIGAYGVELSSFVHSVESVDLLSGETQTHGADDCRFAYRDSVFKGELADRCMIQSVTLDLPRNGSLQLSYPSLHNYLEEQQLQPQTPAEVAAAVEAVRRARLPDPVKTPNAGSFFKNPTVSSAQAEHLKQTHDAMPQYPQSNGRVRLAAGWLIEACGFKERTSDPVRVHAEHALVITNPERRGGSEVMDLAESIHAEVLERFGIALEQEPRSYGWV